MTPFRIFLVGLILVEVLYDVPGTDDNLEWVKLYNGSAATVDRGLAL